MKKVISLVLAVVMIMALATTAFAQIVGTAAEGTGSITVSNASKGVTYSVVKLFDASVTGTANGSIVYTGTIPETLTNYFEYTGNKDANDNSYVVAKVTTMDAAATAALKAWAETQTATASAESDGSVLTFAGLPYGYYVVLTTQGAAISLTSTNPTGTVRDKNTTDPDITKVVDDDDVDIGQKVTYTVTANTATFLDDESGNSHKITKYEITDTLPAFLDPATVKVESITIGGVAYTVNGVVPQFTQADNDEDLEIVIPWVDANGDSAHDAGADIVVTYSATVSSDIIIDAKEANDDMTDGNVNTVTLIPYYMADTDEDGEGDDEQPWDETWPASEEIYTYAAALQKIDENKKPLAGAKFSAKGLTVTGAAGVYTVVSYDPTSETYGTEMVCDTEGQLVILGLSSASKLTVKETEAPAGYNLLATTAEMTPAMTGEEIKATEQTIYYDATGKVTSDETDTFYTKTTYNVDLLTTAVQVVNQKGNELPSTGGMGTTLIYVMGTVLVLGAAVLLITKKRMA